MAPSFRAVGTVAGADSGNVASIGLPAGHALNDLLLLTAVQHDNVASTVSGYTLVASQTNGANMTVRIFAKFDGGSEAAPTLTHTAGATTHCWIAAYQGMDPSLGLGVGAGQILRDVQNTTGSGTGTLTVTSPALSGLQAGDLRVNINAHDGTDTSGAIGTDWGQSLGFTERADTGRIGATSSNTSELADLPNAVSAGTSASGNVSGFAGTRSWIGFQLGLTGPGAPGPRIVKPPVMRLQMYRRPGVSFMSFLAPVVDFGVAVTTIDLAGQGLDHVRAIGTGPTVSPSVVTTGLDHGRTLGAPHVNPTIVVTALVHSRTQGNLATNATLVPAGIVHTRVQGAPQVNVKIFTAGLDHARALGSPTVTTPGAALTPAGLVHTRGSSSPVVSVKLVAQALDHGRTLGQPAVLNKILTASLTRTRALGAVRVTVILQPAGLVHTRTLGSPQVNDKLFLSGLDHGRALGNTVAFVPGIAGPDSTRMTDGQGT